MTETLDAAALSELLEEAIARHRAFDFDEAERLYRAVLAAEPGHADGLHNLGVLYAIGLARPDDALPHFEAALNVGADRPQFWFSYIDALIRARQHELAGQVLPVAQAHGVPMSMINSLAERLQPQASVEEAPAGPVVDATLDEAEQKELVALFHAGDFVQGERSARSLLQRHPDSGFLWKALGTMLQAQSRKPEALHAKRRSVELAPDDVEALCNLGRALFEIGDNAESADVLMRAIALAPRNAEAHQNLGLALGALGRVSEAHTHFERAIQIRPDFAEGWNNLSGIYTAQGRIDEAVVTLQRSLALKPGNRVAFGNLLFVLNYHPDKSAEEIRAIYADYDRVFGAPQRSQWRAHSNSRTVGRRLRVGYVSPDFRHHACTFFLEPLLQGHEHAAFEVFAYAELQREDAVTQRYRHHVDHWLVTEGMSAEALAERIRADGIDILVDLAGHTAGNRLDAFALKPAPVSLSWMGYGYTTGLTAIDYYLTDATSAPPGCEHLFSEQPWRLADAPYTAYRPGPGMGDCGPLPALRNGYVTLGTLTRGVRLNHRSVQVWAELLRLIPRARLVIDSKSYEDAELAQALLQTFERAGVERERLSIGFHTPPWEVLRGIDIGLDCFPHNSGTTLFESLYMGVPFVTLSGRPSVGRIGSAILQGLGRPEWIAEDEAAYVAKVVALAQDLPQLAALRAGLRAEMQASALMDEAGFVHKVEDAYRQMFARWCVDPGDTTGDDLAASHQAEVLYDQANALHERGRASEAEALLRQALVLRPGYAEACNNLGLLLQEQNRSDEALACYRAALQIRPAYALAHHNLGNLLQHHGDLTEAVACYERALALGLASRHFYDNLLFLLNYHPTFSAEQIRAYYADFERAFGAPQRTHWTPHRNARRLGRRLKVGYVSPDFCQHACRYFVEPLLAAHDKAVVEIVAYAELLNEDEATQRYKTLVDHWVPTRGLSDEALAERIRADRIDILVDLAGHTRGNRLGVFALKPAPVSVSWMGYGSTTGLAAIDYYLTDAASAPPGSEHLFSETPWRLPGVPYAVYRPDADMGACGPLPALRNGHVTFGTLSRSIRLNERLLRVWATILQRLPLARLVVDSRNFSDAAASERLCRRFEALGVARDRLSIGCHSPPWDVLRNVDIGLDCFPHNSGTTLFEGLYMGVPFVSLAGRPSVGRIGSAILQGLDRPEWIASSEDDYVDKVVALASDLPALGAVRAGLRAELRASPLMDEARFAHTVEDAYRQMFARWANGRVEQSAPAETEPSMEDMQALTRLFQERRYEQGVVLAHTLAQRFPNDGFVFKALGVMLQPLGRADEALAAKLRAAELLPGDAEAQCNLGMLLQAQGRLAEAAAVLQRALQLRPNYREAHNNLGITYQKQGRLDESLAHFQQALALDATQESIHSNMLFTLNYHPDLSAEQIYTHYRDYDQRFGLPLRGQWQRHGNDRNPQRRLRIGYVSPDFRRHACQRFLEPLLAAHDKAVVEVFAYAELAREDDVTQRYRGLVDHWIATRGRSDEELAQRVRADGIDILVDLAGHTVGNRLGLFARKPAPVSLSWLGFGYTSGLSSINHFLTDAVAAPEGCEPLFAETPWRLPAGWCFRPDPGMGEPGPLPALARGHVTLGTLTRAVRINHHTVRVWCEILRRLPDAHLVVDSSSFSDPAAQDALRDRFTVQGIAPERLHIGYHSPPWDVLRGIDIGLDCFPHNSGTTLFETLYMGVPYVSLAGRPSVGRLGSSILQGAGCAEWIAVDDEAYVAKVVALASDTDALAGIRCELRGRMQASVLMDEAGFARETERAYQQMFSTWCAGSDHPLQALVERAQAIYNEGNRLHDEGAFVEAEASYRRALACVPEQAEAHSNLGLLLQQQGRFSEALQCYREALVLRPDSAMAHYNLGACLQARADFNEAETCFRAALALKPSFQGALFGLDVVLQEQGRVLESESHWRQLLRDEPENASGYRHLAGVLRKQQRNDEALACLVKACELEPESAQQQQNLAVLYRDVGRFADAEDSCRRALMLEPESAAAWSSLAELHNALQRTVEAEQGFRRAIALEPEMARAHGNLGIVLQNQGRLAEAETSMRRALALNPDDRAAHGNLLFVLNYHPDKTGAQVFDEYRAYEQRFFAPLRSEWRAHVNAPLCARAGAARRLKVGYVSPDFRQHSVVNFLEPLLVHHDRSKVDVYAYAELQREDAATARYKGLVEHWVPTSGLSDARLAERIRADGIDILVDLAGHTGGNRLSVFARKPAPVSLSWMGYGYTTGLSAIDYFLTDAASAPAGSESVFAEQPWRLPVGWVYRPAGAARMGEPGPLPAERNGCVTFGTLTRAIRINEHTVRVWAALLARVPNARLVIDSTSYRDAETQESLAARFAAHGVARERLRIGCHSPPWDLLRDVDIGLDCFPHNSGTTLFETLYMGIPFVSLAGRPSVGCLGSSILHGVGHPEWIATTEDEYVEKAAALAADLPSLAALRAGLRHDMQQSLLMNEPAFAHEVEAAYRDMFTRWEHNKKENRT